MKKEYIDTIVESIGEQVKKDIRGLILPDEDYVNSVNVNITTTSNGCNKNVNREYKDFDVSKHPHPKEEPLKCTIVGDYDYLKINGHKYAIESAESARYELKHKITIRLNRIDDDDARNVFSSSNNIYIDGKRFYCSNSLIYDDCHFYMKNPTFIEC